jgi:hypothetical protein
MKTKLRQIIWNKSIRNCLIASFWFLVISQLAIFIWSKIRNIDFFQVYQNMFGILNKSICLKIWIGLISLIIIGLIIFLTLKKRIKKEGETKNQKEPIDKKDTQPPKTRIIEAPTVFFHYRFCDAFPGFSYGFKWFTSKKEIKNRLLILLEKPLSFDIGDGHGIDRKPIWWFRGSSARPIERFETLSRTKFLMDIDELIIEKIAAYRGQSYFEDFVYVQCLPDKPTGLYKHDKEYIEKCYKENGEYQEEFGIYKNRFVTRQEYDDGSSIIKGKPIRIEGAELRSRSLTKYNFIIAAKFSPYNCQDFYRNSEEYFGKLLRDEIQFDDFVKWMKRFPKNHNDD